HDGNGIFVFDLSADSFGQCICRALGTDRGILESSGSHRGDGFACRVSFEETASG
ncbi:MAG: hypothetical protein H6Q76_1493, partial [Firmicutes bacterium]|nr:hypothetical protein [Bacillota bacterium]